MIVSQRNIVSVFFILFALSALFLFWQNERELDPNQGKSWWTLAFADPNNEASLDFVIDNYGTKRSFVYELWSGGEALKKEAFEMETGDKRVIRIQADRNPSGERLRILVSSGEERKEIYR